MGLCGHVFCFSKKCQNFAVFHETSCTLSVGITCSIFQAQHGLNKTRLGGILPEAPRVLFATRAVNP